MKVRPRTECIWRMLAILIALSVAAMAFAGCESKQAPDEEVKMQAYCMKCKKRLRSRIRGL